MNIRVDGREVQVAEGTMLIDAIRETGTEVPSMCYLKENEGFASCMVCVVKDAATGKIFPSCARHVEEGMEVISGDDQVREARKTALELLLSEHVGDCEAPCQVTCPAHMDIPLMNRLLAQGNYGEALQVVKKDIALPAVMGRICPAPCEGACRRKPLGGSVSICLLKRYAGDHDLAREVPWEPPVCAPSGKRVTIVGAGPAGLAAAYHLALKGHQVTVVDRNGKAGGSMRKEVPEGELPESVLDSEIGLIERTGVEFVLGRSVDREVFVQLSEVSDAMVVATGKGDSGAAGWGLPVHSRGLEADPGTYRVQDTAVFVAGSALKPSRMAIRALGQGKEAAFSVDQYLRGLEVGGEPRLFNSRFGKLAEAEWEEYLKESVQGDRIEPASSAEGLTPQQVMEEAARCMHCDCRDLEDCRLRIYSDLYGAQQNRFRSEERVMCRKHDQHDLVIYEPSKCIKCGICVRLTEMHGEEFGFTFIGRGFEVEVETPFNESLKNSLRKVALETAAACPTGAISKKE